jgi:uncharacterized protein
MRNAIFALILAAPLFAQAPPLDDGYVRRAAPSGHGLAPGMKVTELARTGRTFFVTMRKGDEIASGLTEFAEQNHIKSAHFTAIGAIDSGVLGWFDPDKRAYKKIVISQEAEILSLVGNITLENGKPFVHAHCTLGLSDGSTKGGHLVEGRVSLSLQVFVSDASDEQE